MAYTEAFEKAFALGMQFEVGPWFNPEDPEVKKGLCSSKDQKRKTGYIDHPKDPGGETKFGVAKNFNTDLNIKTLTLDQAKKIYFDRYWKICNADKLPHPLAGLFFDAVINCGSSAATKFLQRALKIKDDGSFGPATLNAVKNAKDINLLCEELLNQRKKYYNTLLLKNPIRNRAFIKGWNARIDTLRVWLKNNI